MRRRRRMRGFAALEMAILTPVAIVLMMLAVYGGRIYLAQQLVDTAANAGARAGSAAATRDIAVHDATRMATAMLANRGRTCMDPSVSVDVSQFRANGEVVVSVSCTAELQDLTLLPLSGTRTLSAVGKSPIEIYVPSD